MCQQTVIKVKRYTDSFNLAFRLSNTYSIRARNVSRENSIKFSACQGLMGETFALIELPRRNSEIFII